jgi:hypothetical protein
MTEEQLRELRNDLYLWLHFVLSDADFIQAMLTTYDSVDLHREIAAVLALVKTWATSV